MKQDIHMAASKADKENLESLSRKPLSQRQLLAKLLVGACVLVFIGHLPVLSVGALSFDDDQYLTNNELVRNPSWASARQFLSEVLEPSTVRGYYQPLTMISLMTDYALGGRPHNLLPFHRTSLLLHLANTVLVILLLHLLFGQAKVAVAVGLLFGLHPMTVEPIAWVSGRKTLLAAFFALWCLILYVRYARKRNGWCYAGCLAMYVLALMSKPTSLPLPALMLLIDFWPLRRLKRSCVLEKLPLFVVGGIVSIITFVSQSGTSLAVLPGQSEPWRIPMILCHNIIFYLYKMIWPANLSSHYAFPEQVGLSDPMVLGGVIGTCILVPLLLISTRWTRKIWTGWLIFFLAILPTMGIIRVTIVIAADRYVYLPSIGILMILASFLSGFWRPPHNNRAVFRRVVVALILVPLISAEAFATRKYLVHWRDSVTLYEHMLSVTPNAAPIHNNLGIARQSRGEFDRAIGHYQRALQLDPGLSHGYYNLGIAFMSKNDPNEASKYFRIAVRINPQDKQSHGHLGKMLAMTGRPIEGLEHLRTAVRLNPAFPAALGDLAWLLATHPDPMVCDAEEALRLAERASALTHRQDIGIVDTLAAAYAAGSQFDLAVAAAGRALQLASGAHDDERADQIRKRLDLYQHGMPFNEDPSKRKI